MNKQKIINIILVFCLVLTISGLIYYAVLPRLRENSFNDGFAAGQLNIIREQTLRNEIIVFINDTTIRSFKLEEICRNG